LSILPTALTLCIIASSSATRAINISIRRAVRHRTVPKTPTDLTMPFDKVMYSPSNWAKCYTGGGGCGETIRVGELRIGTHYEHTWKYSENRWRWYHERCCSAEMKANLNLEHGRRFEEELAHLNQTTRTREEILQERIVLREALIEMRGQLARNKGFDSRLHYKICEATTLDDIVIAMPHNSRELKQIDKMTKDKVQDYGVAILMVSNKHRLTFENRD
jgi:hypothetical protein